MKALIVDDHRFVRDGIKSLLAWEEMGFDSVAEADNGATALQMAITDSPDLVITDIKMPVMDGVELTRRLRETMADTYIIMLSAYDEWPYARAAMQYNVSDYIIKPLTQESVGQLSDKIRAIVADSTRKKSYREAILSSRRIEKGITTALHKQDTSYIVELFEKELPEMGLRCADAKDCCVLLVNLLFSYLHSTDYPSQRLSEYEIEAIDHVNYLKKVDELYGYTYAVYMELLQFFAAKVDGSRGYIGQIFDYIEASYTQDSLSVEKIAAALHLTPTYVGSIFKQYEKVNLITYINEYRIGRACELLYDLELPVNQVGRMVGISDPNYFARLFKRVKGVTPTEYRTIVNMGV